MKKQHYLPLRRRIEDAGYNLKELAAQTDIGTSTLSKRLAGPEGKGEWRGSEILAICKAVGIPRREIGELFFPTVDKEVSA